MVGIISAVSRRGRGASSTPRRVGAAACCATALLLGGCGSSANRVSPETTLRLTRTAVQPFAGFGTAAASDLVLDPLANTTGLQPSQVRRMDDDLLGAGVRLVRVFGPLQLPDRPPVTVWSSGDPRLRMMRRLAPRGVRFIFTGSGAPADLVEDGAASGPLIAGAEAAYARFLVGCIAAAAAQGTPFALAAVGNEVDNGRDAGVTLTAAQTATVLRVLQADLKRRRLPTRVALGDNTSWKATRDYAAAQAPMLAAPPAVVASHAYGGDAGRDDVAALARALRAPVWMTEWVSACPRGNCSDDPSMARALVWARQITRDITRGQAAAWFVFRGVADSTHGADGAIIVRDRGRPEDPLRRTKRYPIMRQFAVLTSPGARRYAVDGAPPAELDAVGFRSPRRRGVVVTNSGPSERVVRLALGRSDDRLRAWRTDAEDDFRLVLDRRATPAAVDLTLPAGSVITLAADGRG